MVHALLILLLLAIPGAASAKQAPPTVTRIAGGAADGSDVARLVRAIEQQRQARRPGRILLTGTFRLEQPIRLTAENSGLAIEAAYPRAARLVAAGGTARGIEIRRANDVRIAGLRLHGFSQDAIYAVDTARITIERNIVEETRSTRWSEGAIHLTGSATDAVIRDNIVKGADYAGIIIDTHVRSDISRATIIGNQVRDTCRRVHDCGAIYVNDRGRKSSNILIANNEVANFGPIAVGGRAIYIDDLASHVTVRRNRIAGPGRYAFQIHGGRNNIIEHNRVDMKGVDTLLRYIPRFDSKREEMTGNRFADNVVVSFARKEPAIAPPDREGAGAIAAARNRIHAGRGDRP